MSWDPSTGCVGTICPPFSSQDQITPYANSLKNVISPKRISNVHIGSDKSNLDPAYIAGAKFITNTMDRLSGNLFPRVDIQLLPRNGCVVIYSETSNNICFAYRNDPLNMSKINNDGTFQYQIGSNNVGTGSDVPHCIKPPPPSPIANIIPVNADSSLFAAGAGSILLSICSGISCVIIIVILFIVMKKKS